MTTVLVTGAAGFVGRHLARRLRAEAPRKLVGVDLRDAVPGDFDAFTLIDLTDARATKSMLSETRPDWIFHLAGAFQGSDDFIRASNVQTSMNIIDGVSAIAPSTRVVLIGSAAEYGVVPPGRQPVSESYDGAPRGPYGRAKAAVSRLAADAAAGGLNVSVGRPFNVFGPGTPDTLVIGAIISRLRAALAGPLPRSIRVGSLNGIRDFVAVEDVADGLIAVAKRGRRGEAYNLCTGVGRRVADVITALIALSGEKIELTVDAALIQSHEVDALVGSREKAHQELAWTPRISFDEELRATWEATSLEESGSRK